jgi:hypothetical protein
VIYIIMDNQNTDTESFEPVTIEHRYSNQTEPIDKKVIKAFLKQCGCEKPSEVVRLDDIF